MEIMTTYEKLGPSECLELVVSNLKNNVPVWEELIMKTTKLNASIKNTLTSSASFIESFQKVADLTTNSPSGLKELGAMLTRFCIRQKGVESKIKTFNNHLVDTLGSPLQDRVEDWKRVNTQFDRERQKDWRRARTELHKADQETQKLKKKSERKNSSNGPDTRLQLEFAQQDLLEKQQVLGDMEHLAMRRALVEDRRRFAEFVACLKPVLDSQLSLLNEVTSLEELINQVYCASTDPNQLPEEAQNLLDQFDPNITSTRNRTPPSSISSSINSATLSRKHQPPAPPALPTTPQSQRSTKSSSNSSSHSSSTTASHNSSQQMMGYPIMGTKLNNRVPSVSSQDSAYSSQDPSKPQENGFDKFSRQLSNDPSDAPSLNERNGNPILYEALNDLKTKPDTEEDDEEEDLSGTSDSEDEGSTTPSSLPDHNQDSPNGVAYPQGFMSLRRHTISAGSAERPGLTSNTFKPHSGGGGGGGGVNASRRQSLYPNQAIPPPIYANMTQLENAARRNYGKQMDQEEDEISATGDTTDQSNLPPQNSEEPNNQTLSMIESLASPQCDQSPNSATIKKTKTDLPPPKLDDLCSWIAYPPAPKGWEDPPERDQSAHRNPLSTYATISRKSRRQDLSGWFHDNKTPTSFSPREIPPPPITPPVRKPASPPIFAFTSKSNQSSTSPLSSSFSSSPSNNQSQYDTPSIYPVDIYATNIDLNQSHPVHANAGGYLNQSDLRSFYRSMSADQSNGSDSRQHTSAPAQHSAQKQSRSSTLVRRSSSTSRAAGSPYSGSQSPGMDFQQGNSHSPRQDMPLYDQLGVRVRCPSASTRPALPPKPRMSMYAAPGEIVRSSNNPIVHPPSTDPRANHAVGRRAERANHDDLRRRRRSEACTSFVGYSSNNAVDIDIDVSGAIPTVYADPTGHTASYLDQMYSPHNNFHPQGNNPPHKRQSSYNNTPDTAKPRHPVQPVSAVHLSDLKQRHRQDGRGSCSPAAVKKRQSHGGGGGVDPLVAALKQGVTLRKTGGGQSGDHQSIYSGVPHQV